MALSATDEIFHFDGCACGLCTDGPPDAETLATDPLASTGDADTPDAPGAGAASRPVYTQDQVIAALTTADGSRESLAWRGDAISYSIGTGRLSPGQPEYDTEHDGYVAMDAAMEARADAAFQLWDDLIAIDLVARENDPGANITFNYSSNSGGSTYARTSYSGQAVEGRADNRLSDADLWFADSWHTQDEASDLDDGGYGMMTYLHEIGHGLGLSHPGPYNGTARFNDDATHFQDTRGYTLMSYFDAYRNGSGTDHFGTEGRAYGATPLLHDILAIQSVYGADMTTRTGDTVYGFNATANRAAFDFTANDNPIVAIWDAGGIDRLDVSGWGTDQVVDLREGAFSSTGFLSENVAIAYGAVIEEAVGGSGDDLIRGNAAANRLWGGSGDDTVEGGAGDDMLWGGAGADLLDGGDGNDTFRDVAAGDIVDGGDGVDRIRGDWWGGGMTLDLAALSLTGIEGALGTAGADSLSGRAGRDALNGAAGVDLLDGRDGDDWLTGGQGDDSLFGGAGDDILTGGAGADLLDGGAGRDRAGYDRSGTGVGVDLETGGFAGDAAGDILAGIEDLNGSAQDDILRGDGAANVLRGLGGSDTIEGRGGDDRILGGNGADLVRGGAGDDRLLGGAGADRLEGNDGTDRIGGGNGDDTIEGGAGDDQLWGGAGADRFLFASGDGTDWIRDFDTGDDRLVFTGAADIAGLAIEARWGDTWITHAPGATVVLAGIDPALLDPDVFAFA